MYNITVNAVVDSEDVLDGLSNDEIIAYLQNNKALPETAIIANSDDYWHGDFNLKAFLKELGNKEVKKVIAELTDEGFFLQDVPVFQGKEMKV